MSEEKKAQTKAERGEKRRQDEQKDRLTMAVYTVVAVVVLAAAVALMFWRSGVLQRGMTALDLNGTKYTAADLQFVYNNLYSNYANQYYFDPSTSVKKQVYNSESGQSWYDFLVEETINALTEQASLAAMAASEGYTLSADAQAQMNSTISQLNTSWISGGYSSRDAFIQANMGPYMSYDRLVELLNQQYLASDYAAAKLDAITHSDADYEACYAENADELDTIVYTQFTFQALVPTTDEQGNTLEMTDAEKSAKLEELKQEQKSLAEELKAKLEAGTDAAALEEEYSDKLYNSSISRHTTGSNAQYSTYGDWLLDSARKSGDITLSENDTGSAFYYYVALYEDRMRDEEPTHNVRHLLVRAGAANSTETPTQEQYDEAEEKANSLLEEWKSGEANEETFSSLVTTKSDDTGSRSSGGLISNITSTSSYVEAFRNWAIDPVRKEGDTGLVKTEYGWHIMYYVSTNDPIWRQSVTSKLNDQDYEQLTADAVQGWTITRGTGINFIEA